MTTSHKMTFISLGAGVQSSALYLLSCQGKIARADFAIFSDTQAEPAEVYKHLEFLKSIGTIPIITVTQGNLTEKTLNTQEDAFYDIPFYIQNDDGTTSMARRQCTYQYKIRPLRKEIREITRGTKGPHSVMIGISRDEAHRMKPADVKYISNEWPLIELGWSRRQCREYFFSETGRYAPRSACIQCPFKSDLEWQALKDNDPLSFAEAVAFERKIQRKPRFKGRIFLHPSCKPLDQIEFTNKHQLNLFGNECEGMCGV